MLEHLKTIIIIILTSICLFLMFKNKSKDEDPSFDAFHPNLSLKIDVLKKNGFQYSDIIDDYAILEKKINGNFFKYSVWGDQAETCFATIPMEAIDNSSLINFVNKTGSLILISDLKNDKSISQPFYIQNLSNNLFFWCRPYTENGENYLDVIFFYPKMSKEELDELDDEEFEEVLE